MAIRRKRRSAPAPPPEPSARERVEWLLEFIRRDVADLSPGELIDLRNGIIKFRHGNVAVDTPDLDELRALFPGDFNYRTSEGVETSVTGDPVQRVIDATRELATRLQGHLREGVETLESTGRWRPFADDVPAPHWAIQRCADGAFERRYTGGQVTVFLASAVDLLLEWWPELRRCKHEPCNGLFLPRHGRQRYHAPACRQANFRRGKRERDYDEESVARVKRETAPGPAAKLRKDRAKRKATKKPTPEKRTRKGKSQ